MQKAFAELNKAKDMYQQLEDNYSVAKCFVNMAIIQEGESDNLGSIESSLSAMQHLNEEDEKHFSFISSNYNNLGVASNSLKNYKNAKKYYELSLKFSKDSLEVLMIKNNLASSYYDQGKYSEASKIYQELLKNLNEKDDVYYKILVNFTRSECKINPTFNPEENYREALSFYQKNDDNWGLDAVYCYYTEFYTDKNADSTKYYAKKMLDVSKKLETPIDQLQALDYLINTETGVNSKKYYQQYKKLSDSLDVVRNSSKNQFALVRFESEKNKAQNLKLEKDLQQKEYIMYSGVFLFVITSFGGLYWYKKRKSRIELKAQNQIKEERLITSKKVHDVVANGLYQVMSGLEHAEEVDKEEILDQLDGMYQKSRDISYDNFNFFVAINYKEKFSELANSFQTDSVNIFMVGNDNELWQNVPKNLAEDLYLIVRELFVNMKKHSQAERIVLRFEKNHQTLQLFYKDNGVGASSFKEKNGLRSIRERITKYNGTLELDIHAGYIVKMQFMW